MKYHDPIVRIQKQPTWVSWGTDDNGRIGWGGQRDGIHDSITKRCQCSLYHACVGHAQLKRVEGPVRGQGVCDGTVVILV